jgi:mRNA interferase MazF
LADLGMVGKVRPCLVISVRTDPGERVLATIIPHTTSSRGTRFEVAVRSSALKPGVFDVQQIVTVPQVKFLRRLGRLSRDEMLPIEAALRLWLGL